MPRPERPILPVITPEQMQCLSDETYRTVITRERLRREYAERLESIIKSTHD